MDKSFKKIVADMNNKSLIKIETVCKYRGDKDLREFIKLFDETQPFKTSIEYTDLSRPADFEVGNDQNFLDKLIDRRN